MSDLKLQQRLHAAGFYPWAPDGVWGKQTEAAVDRVIALALEALARRKEITVTQLAPAIARPVALTDKDYRDAAALLDGRATATAVARVLAVKKVESGGGWFTDLRKDILDLDGPGGFIDGVRLPKILFEAHLFSRYTGGRFDKSNPRISAPTWDRTLYVGGQGEYARLHEAMLIDPEAALKAASWAMFQILGANYKAAGFPDVHAYVDAMKRGEREQLMAFVNFIRNTPGLLAKYRKISADPKTCEPFCAGYNGPAYRANSYHTKTAAAFAEALRAA